MASNADEANEAAMEYKKFGADIRYNATEVRFDGLVLGAFEDLHFTGKSISELKSNFEATVDRYLARCASKDTDPYRDFAGKIPLRVSGELHRALFIAAQQDGKSLNKWIKGALTDCLARRRHK